MKDIEGNLVFDSWTDSLPELRSGRSDERHLIYEGGGVLLDLLLRPSLGGASLQVDGQVLPADDLTENVANVPVLLEDGAASHETRTNALGEFRFQQGPCGEHFDVSIVLGTRRFLVRGLESQDPRDWQVVVARGNGENGSKKELR